MIEIWITMESKTPEELREMADHFDALKKSAKLHPDEKVHLDNLEFIDGYIGGIRNFYRERVLRRIK